MRQILHNLFWWSVEVSNRDRDVVRDQEKRTRLILVLTVLVTLVCLIGFWGAGRTAYGWILTLSGLSVTATACDWWMTLALYTPWRQPSAGTEIVLRKPFVLQMAGIVLSAVSIPFAGLIALTIFAPPFYPGKTFEFSAGLLVFLTVVAASVSVALPWEMRIDLRRHAYSVSTGIFSMAMPCYGSFEDIAGLFVRHLTKDRDLLYVKWKRRRWPMLIGQFPPGAMAATQGHELAAAMAVPFLD